ncbi:N-acetylglucosamine-6-phosphate deacetylase [Sphingobacterium gobiense]|uniref:N-acetylglucosamine-6-phosphate deacetylase n=1 Tax=Sphingobacterium gobiense TaxID=1382456 RepID=A0A2S9JD56_9SPHI|nr:N-acetylglucosamine-6-phosphate deacetylase [Sphingobacterium gobiense]PRD50812.1 N-acetylglucosamine-6-phosphate deacetylase [Sphingobacterium gobiense]
MQIENKEIALVNGHIFNGDHDFSDHALVMQGEKIVGICPVSSVSAEAERIDVKGANICPGLVDLQIYGAGDDLFSAELTTESIARIERQLLAQGCTSFVLTLATNTMEMFKEAIRVFNSYQPLSALGLHLEGPFLNPLKRGAHPAELIVSPSVALIADLLDSDKGAVIMMTIAPEQFDTESIDFLLERSILLSAGHSAASFEQGMQGFNNSIKAATHLWNAMSPFHHRDIGLPGAVFRHSEVLASIIVDGIHVDFQAVKIAKALIGRRLFLITDAVAACDKGIYRHVLHGDHYTLPDGTLSGSALSLLGAIRNCVQHVDIPLEEAIRMATCYPANLIGRSDIGNLDAGAWANVLVFDTDFNIHSVYCKGEQVDLTFTYV